MEKEERLEKRRLTKEGDNMSKKFFTQEEWNKAYNADLASFLLEADPDHYLVQSGSVRLIYPDLPKRDRIKSISVKLGKSFYHDFKTDHSGSAVEYLQRYMGYGYVDAVKALASSEAVYRPKTVERTIAPEELKEIELPEAYKGFPKHMYAYLNSRGIPSDVIQNLEKAGFLYQAKDHNNIVFVSRDKDFCELRGTYTFGDPFHGVQKTKPDCYWDFIVGDPKRAYICEAAIDAISLYLLLKMEGKEQDAMYVSIAGVGNQAAIDRIRDELMDVVIAVDNDAAGDECRKKNPECPVMLPLMKDWNQDLLAKLE